MLPLAERRRYSLEIRSGRSAVRVGESPLATPLRARELEARP